MEQSSLVLLGIAATVIVALLGLIGIMWRGRNGSTLHAQDPQSTRGGDVSQAQWERFFSEHVTKPIMEAQGLAFGDLRSEFKGVSGELRNGFADMKLASADQKKIAVDTLEELRTIRRNGGTR